MKSDDQEKIQWNLTETQRGIKEDTYLKKISPVSDPYHWMDFGCLCRVLTY